MDQPVLASVTSGVTGWTQTFTYDAAGRMATNSRVGTYAYANPTVARHAPSSVTPASGPVQTFTYDANGNMTQGLDAKVMTYDGENRPLSVTFAGKKTCYSYGADGARLKKFENYTGANCATPLSGASVTVYLGPAEVRKFGQWAAEQLILYPTPEVRIVKKIVSGSVTSETTALHRDGLGSVRAVTAGTGMRTETSSYRPYGEQSEGVYALNVPEARGYVGERLDADAGLQFLNARYYDPKLGMFLQPDWWEVTEAGVGTNRYSYSFGDPVNGRDPGGHQSIENRYSVGRTIGDLIRDLFSGRSTGRSNADIAANANGTADRLKADAKSAARTALGLTPVGAAADLVDAARRRKLGAAALAAAGLIPGEGIVGRTVGKIAGKVVKTPAVKETLSNIGRVISETLSGKGNFTSGTKLSADELLEAGAEFLGPGYREIGKPGSGVFRSADGTRQFRIDNSSLTGAHAPDVPHGHLEVYERGATKPEVNNHIEFFE